ncbi:phosphoenolpyruvate synthase [Haladaptatus salinisoli]|uniref:phosphoenolpyruvate synthase n=1 Tax=Haladaptatus salinisoli TaxID=2884876 RepID=UPI001D09B847|nr:phosphoenolpyruvate synthase [Haladaptatus salinisoli]
MSNLDSRESLEVDDPYVVTLNHPAATDRALVGGKGANLARLVEAGLPVPDGLCVTILAYRELIDDNSVDVLLDDLSNLDPTDTEALAEVGSSLRARIENQDVPPSIREAIENALANVKAEGGSETAYAVRSSATAEDLPNASFAGQQETFLNVRGVDEIIDRVRACMASLFTDRAIAYRATNDIPHEEVALAVVVQEMITPDVSGICFTADPRTGNRRVTTIEAGIGLGEALVAGDVTGDAVRVETRTGEILDYEVGDQQIAVQPLSEGGTETVELDSAGSARVLSDKQVRMLVELGEEIEALFERPQDIEWCLADGDIYIVQARPITSLFPLPSPEPEDDRLHVYYNFGHAQAMPEAMPPLVRDVWMAYVHLWMEEFGMDPDTQWFVEAGGRLYMDMTTLLRIGVLRRRVPDQLAAMSESIGAAFEDLLARRGEEFQNKRTARDTLAALPRFAGVIWRSVWMGLPITSMITSGFFGAFVGEPDPPQLEETKWTAWGRNVAARVHAPDTPVERVHAAFELSEEAVNFPPIGPMYAALAAEQWLQGLFPDAPEDVNDVAKGLPNELVTRINLGLGDLADVARDHPEVAEALRAGASLDEIEACEGGEVFRAALNDYLEEFGHRATGEIDISRPRWREEPSGLLATVRANLKHEQAGEHRAHLHNLEREASVAAERLEERAAHGLLGPLRKRVVRQLIRTYRGYIQTREYPKQGIAHLFAAWHETFREAGEVLVAEGRLDDPDDIWFLRKDELLAALEGESIDVDLPARRTEFERHAAMDAPPVLTSEGEAPSAQIKRADVPDGVLVGTGVSSGVVEGTARIVRDPTEETIESGEILIAPSSDPGWTPLFLNAAGMVVEVGTRMSHGAIVAREYGLPAVVSVPEATRRIETGQRVRIDGTQGTVEIIEDDS